MPAAQLRALREQHAELVAACQLKDAELAELRDIVDAAGALQAQDVQADRIIQLSKAVRKQDNLAGGTHNLLARV
jgi:hypothetical protein